MSKRIARMALVGALPVGVTAALLLLWACVPVPVIGADKDKPAQPGPAGPVTPAALKGQVKVEVRLPADARQAQSIVDAVNTIDLSVTGANWSPALTATIAKSDIADNAASRTFPDVPTGTATIAATAKDSSNATLATASAVVTVAADQIVTATLTLRFSSGDIAAQIDIVVTSPVQIGEHGAQQHGATYVGQSVCGTCHADIQAKFKDTAHYKGIRDSSGNVRYPAKGRPSCAACHATGNTAASYETALPFDYVTKAASDSPNDLVSTITCEACHGPGSKHVGARYADRFKTITRIPASSATCASCHAGYSKKYDAAGKPVFEPGSTSYQAYEIASFSVTGVPEEVYMAGGAHNSLGMGPVTAVYDQTGGYTGGAAVTFSNAHKTQLANGCVSCHMGGTGTGKHTFMIDEASSSAIVDSCQKCHGTGFNEDSIKSFQGQTRMAIASLKSVLVAYRQAFAKEGLWVPRTGTATKSADVAVFGENLSYAPSLWDDSDDYVKTGAASDSAVASKVNWTDKKNWTDEGSHWSAHQKLYNQAYWNYSLSNGELSYGIHAPTYTQYLLRTSYNALVTELKAKNATGSANFGLMSLK